MKNTFIGFSTLSGDRHDSYKLYDIQLVRQDLYNHFFTRIGERIMRPEYGCRIWNYLMEQFTPEVAELTKNEVMRICHSDSRVELIDTLVFSSGHALVVSATVNYKPFNVVDTFRLNFENNQSNTGF